MRLAGWSPEHKEVCQLLFDLGWEVVVGSLQTMVGPDLPITESPYGECIVRDENRSMGRVCTVGDNGQMLGTYFGAYCEVRERAAREQLPAFRQMVDQRWP